MSDLDASICVAPLTPTYSTLPRLNITVLLLFVLLSPKSSWATKGALAALMARVATISIHAVVLLAVRDMSHAFELDCIAAWFILSEIAVATPIMLSWAPALHGSKARLLVKTWGLLVFVGAVCGFAVVKWAREHIDGRTCSKDADPDNLIPYSRSEIFARLRGDTVLGQFDIAALAVAAIGLLIYLRPSQLWRTPTTPAAVRNLVRYADLASLTASTAVLVAIIVLHERYLLGQPSLPMLLPISSYEQWSCWAAAGFIVLATIVNWLFGSKMSSSQGVPLQSTSRGSKGYHEGINTLDGLTVIPYDQWTTNSQHDGQPMRSSTVEKPWRGRKSDLEWAGVVGKPIPSHIR